MNRTLFLGMVVLSCLVGIPAAYSESEWDLAAKKIVRLLPDQYTQVPADITEDLTKSGCTIPQTWDSSSPHNVIQGEFARKGQKDWAVLCSKDGVSSIVIFWGGAARCSSGLKGLPDKNFLQKTGPGIGYSRLISPAGKEFIVLHAQTEDGEKPPLIDHEGINDEFMDKGSSVHYCTNGQWMQLAGSD